MHSLRFPAIVSLLVAIACSGGGGSTGPGGTNTSGGSSGGTNDPYGGGTGNASCPTGSVCMLGSSYDPSSITVAKGSIVNFVNNSGVFHTVTFDAPQPPGVTDVPLNNSGTYPRTFNDAGHFTFHCTQHASMKGEITVQ